jgi:hypothetical protein
MADEKSLGEELPLSGDQHTVVEHTPRMVRFDFEPGASPKEIAEAIERVRKRLRREYAEAQAKALRANAETDPPQNRR